MEEVKKKRFRPTLTAYRELEEQVRALTESNTQLQEKYRKQLSINTESSIKITELEKKCRDAESVRNDVVSKWSYEELLTKCDTLEKSNKYADDCISRLQNELSAMTKESEKYHTRCNRLLNRSFFERVFNKDF